MSGKILETSGKLSGWQTFGNIWKHLETFGNIWKHLETFLHATSDVFSSPSQTIKRTQAKYSL